MNLDKIRDLNDTLEFDEALALRYNQRMQYLENSNYEKLSDILDPDACYHYSDEQLFFALLDGDGDTKRASSYRSMLECIDENYERSGVNWDGVYDYYQARMLSVSNKQWFQYTDSDVTTAYIALSNKADMILENHFDEYLPIVEQTVNNDIRDIMLDITTYGDYLSEFASERHEPTRYMLSNEFEEYVSDNGLTEDVLSNYRHILEEHKFDTANNNPYHYDSIYTMLLNIDRFNKGDANANFWGAPLDLIQSYQMVYQNNQTTKDDSLVLHREVKDLISETSHENDYDCEP